MKEFIWRLRFSLYGNRKTKWGFRLWWEWSDSNYSSEMESFGRVFSPIDAADEEIYAACT